MLGLTFSSKLEWGSYIISIAKTASKKVRNLIHSIKFFSCGLLCISINLTFSYAWNTLVMSRLVFLVATWNCWISYKNDYADCWSFPCCLYWTLAHHWNIASLSLFYRYYFGRWSSEPVELVPLPYSPGRSIRFSDILHDLSPFLDATRMSVSTGSFAAQLNSGFLCL